MFLLREKEIFEVSKSYIDFDMNRDAIRQSLRMVCKYNVNNFLLAITQFFIVMLGAAAMSSYAPDLAYSAGLVVALVLVGVSLFQSIVGLLIPYSHCRTLKVVNRAVEFKSVRMHRSIVYMGSGSILFLLNLFLMHCAGIYV